MPVYCIILLIAFTFMYQVTRSFRDAKTSNNDSQQTNIVEICDRALCDDVVLDSIAFLIKLLYRLDACCSQPRVKSSIMSTAIVGSLILTLVYVRYRRTDGHVRATA